MKLKEIQILFHNELDALFGKEEVDNFFFILIESYYGIKRFQLAMDTNLGLENNEAILSALKLLKQEKPIQYILGHTEFYGLPFKANKHVLIPRPETEELISWIIENTDVNEKLKILDIGTGSGCIAVSLAKNLPKCEIVALDISANAIKVAEGNAQLNNVEITFVKSDILNVSDISNELINKQFDIIVSNPPYVREREKEHMKPNVLDNEPHIALFVKDNNPLQFYEAIVNFAENNLTSKGLLYFEINEYLGDKMIFLLQRNDFQEIELKQDIFKKDRMIKGIKS